MTSFSRIFLACFVAAVPLLADDWPTFGHDPQRSGWAREERVLSRDNVSGLKLKWKVKLENETKSLTALTSPIVVSGVATENGPKDLVYVGGSGDVFYAIDTANGEVVWSKIFKTDIVNKRPGMWLCPKGLNATPAADPERQTIYVIASDGRLYALDLATGKEKFRAVQFVPPFSKNWSLNLRGSTVYTSISQNCGDTPSGVASMDLSDPVRPVVRNWRAARYGAGVWGRGGIVLDDRGRIFGATGDGDFDPAASNYGQTMFALNPDTLQLLDYFTPRNWEYLKKRDFDMTASPVVFAYNNRQLLAVGGKEGLVYLMDADGLGGDDHQSCLHTTPLLSNDEEWFEGKGVWGGVSAYRDSQGRHWLYVPLWGPLSSKGPTYPHTNGPNPNGSVAAFIVEDSPATGEPFLKAAWVSGDLAVPEPVAIANDVVFVLANGENVRQTVEAGIFDRGNLQILKDTERLEGKARAELRALDAHTGRELWRSEPGAFETWSHFSGLAVANGQVYAVDFSSTLYCFALGRESP